MKVKVGVDMIFEEQLYQVAVSRGHANAKALAYFLFREIIEDAHVKYNISQEDMKAMNKKACDRAEMYLDLSEKEREAFKIEAIGCDCWDPPEITEDIATKRKIYHDLSKLI